MTTTTARHRARRPTGPVRRRRAIVVVGMVAVILVGAAVWAFLHRSPPGPPPAPVPSATGPVRPASVEPPAPPKQGAWLGAWVQPDDYGTDGRLQAVTGLEALLGRPLPLINTYHDWSEPFPSGAERRWLAEGRTLMISWAGADTQEINAGRYDDQIRRQADQLRRLDQPVLLRWRWEMNRHNLRSQVHDPATFVAAWRRIHTIFVQEGATNVGWVWCPLARDFARSHGEQYYPGDDQVDWLCTDVYAGPDTTPFADVSADFRAWAAGKDKPILIGELGAQVSGPERVGWWQDAFATVQQWPQVKGVALFDSKGSPDEPYNLWLPDDPGVLAAVQAAGADSYFAAGTGLRGGTSPSPSTSASPSPTG